MRSSIKYWQIIDNEIYESPFDKNTVVGVLWSSKVDYATWFGGNISNFKKILRNFESANVEFIHCIQMLPFTPITEELLVKQWVTKEFPVLSQCLSKSIEQGY